MMLLVKQKPVSHTKVFKLALLTVFGGINDSLGAGPYLVKYFAASSAERVDVMLCAVE